MSATTPSSSATCWMKTEMHLWRERIAESVTDDPAQTEDEITRQPIEEMAVRGAELLLPVFEREGGRKGRLSIRTDPRVHRDAARIAEQAVRFSTLAPDMQVRNPVT
jgi:transaldolase